MPRDGSGIYSQPFPDVVEGTTIESTVYNGYTADITIDLNSPRPISSGGTGATNAADAMASLGGEGSKIEVLNYDSHAFTAGSFYSKASATNPPVPGHAFAGICYVAVVSGIATSDMFVEVRDRDELTQPGSLYVRQKKNGTWSGWLKAIGATSSATPPTPAATNALWWDPTRGKLFIYYADADTSQWVEAVATPDMNPDDFVRIDAPQTLTETQKTQARKNIYAAPFDALAYNGMQVNGNADVSQEFGASGVNMVAANNTARPCDGWAVFVAQNSGAVNMSAHQAGIGGPPGHGFGVRVLANNSNFTAATNGDNVVMRQTVEGYRMARLAWGTSAPYPLSYAMWLYSTVPGTIATRIVNNAVTRSYYTEHTVGAGWNWLTATIPGADAAGVWLKDNGAGLYFDIMLGAKSPTIATPGSWGTVISFNTTNSTNLMATAGNNVYVTGFMLLPGSEVPQQGRSALIMRPYDQELLTCRRYWQQVRTALDFTHTSAATIAAQGLSFSPVMRAVPSLNLFATTGTSNCTTNYLNITATGLEFQISSVAAGRAYFYGNIVADARL